MAELARSGVAKRIVVGTDGSETAELAVSRAAALAAALGAELIVVSAHRRAPGGFTTDDAELDANWAVAASVAARQAAERGVELARELGVEQAVARAVPGDAADILLDEAESTGADLLVVGSKGMQSSRRFLLGSVPNKISHQAPCDLLIVRTSR
jgi:nucleotide-binding universal stress UspA family protein